ncbi:hypothetical protein D3C80_1994480 [compost metagenome]
MLHKPKRALQHKLSYFYMIFRQLVKGGRYNLSFNGALHIRHFLRTLIYKQYEQFNIRAILRNAVSNFLQ